MGKGLVMALAYSEIEYVFICNPEHKEAPIVGKVNVSGPVHIQVEDRNADGFIIISSTGLIELFLRPKTLFWFVYSTIAGKDNTAGYKSQWYVKMELGSDVTIRTPYGTLTAKRLSNRPSL